MNYTFFLSILLLAISCTEVNDFELKVRYFSDDTILLENDHQINWDRKNYTTRIILIRHAEKSDGIDPDLSDPGKDRAKLLANLFRMVTIDGIYSTDYKRTLSTIAYLCADKGMPPIIYDPQQPQMLLDQIIQSNGKTFIVVGHSNTVPELVNRVMGELTVRSLDESEYNKMFIYLMNKSEVNYMHKLQYGR